MVSAQGKALSVASRLQVQQLQAAVVRITGAFSIYPPALPTAKRRAAVLQLLPQQAVMGKRVVAAVAQAQTEAPLHHEQLLQADQMASLATAMLMHQLMASATEAEVEVLTRVMMTLQTPPQDCGRARLLKELEDHRVVLVLVVLAARRLQSIPAHTATAVLAVAVWVLLAVHLRAHMAAAAALWWQVAVAVGCAWVQSGSPLCQHC